MTEELNTDVKKLRFLDENGETYSEWEEKKLGEVSTVIGGGTPSTEKDEYWDGDVNWFSPSEIKSKYAQDSVKKITKKGLSKSSAKILPIGTVLVTTRATLGKMSILTKESSTNQGFQNVVAGDSLNNQFFYYQQPLVEKFCILNSGGSTFKEISKSEFVKYRFNIPSLPEQTKIADFLSNLDERIETQSKLVELLKEQKQGYSQRLFNGSLRFKKDDGTDYEDWEEKKLGEIGITFRTGKKDANEGDKFGKYNFYTCSSEISKINSYSFNGESLLIAGNGVIGDVKYYNGKFDAYQRVYVLQNFSNLSVKFFQYLIKYNLLQIIHKEQMGSTLKYIRLSTLTEMNFYLPSLPEQEKIAAFLSSLDNRIDEQLNKLEQLKQEKQAYMQRVLG